MELSITVKSCLIQNLGFLQTPKSMSESFLWKKIRSEYFIKKKLESGNRSATMTRILHLDLIEANKPHNYKSFL